MTALEPYAPASAIPATRTSASAGSPARDPAKVLLRHLTRLYTAERQLAFDLPRLFHQSTVLALRLALSDHRKETSRQLVRLELIIQTARTEAPSPVDVHSDGDFIRGAPAHTIAAIPLKRARAAIAGYRSAIALANRMRLHSMAELLTESLNEKRNASVVLSRFAVQPE